ncbi:MAG: hypothetical protein A2089_03780 [Elusimicrobia bacterium GWD2_63_28]|nr:MAG: hypothetical protein A2089_03780 [Elusimicrobia bacterium GWD2_63_28]
MDTIMKNIPMPKIFFHSIVRDSDTYRVVIDGQQRIKAILSFLKGDYRLAPPYDGEYIGRIFSELPSSIQDDFLSYKIDTNEIRNAPDDVVRNIYQRVNKYTVALNRQELRRADYPGEFLSLSEELAQSQFLEEAKVFTIANSKRMGDVEFVSELLALLISGPQEKRDTLDDFYLNYARWDTSEKAAIKARFERVLKDMKSISDQQPAETLDIKTFSQMRFRQKADFYSLFAAIDECNSTGGTLEGRSAEYLKEDLQLIDYNTEPESEIGILRKYAIQCISQANSIASRRWRKDFLKLVIEGTYFSRPPNIEGVKVFHSLLWDLYTPGVCPTASFTCPVCGEEGEDYSTEKVFLTWKKTSTTFQIMNAVFIHNACKEKARNEYHVWDATYAIPDNEHGMIE